MKNPSMTDLAIQALIRERVSEALEAQRAEIKEGFKRNTNALRFPPEKYIELYHSNDQDLVRRFAY